MGILNIILCLFVVYYLSRVIDISVNLWQQLPLKEEPSTPIYIIKVIE